LHPQHVGGLSAIPYKETQVLFKIQNCDGESGWYSDIFNQMIKNFNSAKNVSRETLIFLDCYSLYCALGFKHVKASHAHLLSLSLKKRRNNSAASHGYSFIQSFRQAALSVCRVRPSRRIQFLSFLFCPPS